jgi:hypothetical protein
MAQTPNAVPVEYYSGPGGTDIRTGYIIDGHTYVDPEGTQRVPIGSIVMTGSGDYILTDQGGKLYSDYVAAVQSGEMSPENVGRVNTATVGTQTNGGASGNSGGYSLLGNGVDDTANAYIQQIYEQMVAANQAALKNAYELNVNTINAQKQLLPETYRTAKNTTAAQAEIQRGNFNEYASAAGLSSGAGGQAQLSMSNALQGNLSALDKAQADALASLDLQLTNLTTQYQNDLTQAFAEGNLARVAALYENYESNKAALLSQAQFEAQMQLSRDQLAQQQSQFDANMAYNQNTQGYNNALTVAEKTGNFSGMAEYGWSPELIAAIEQQWKEDHDKV